MDRDRLERAALAIFVGYDKSDLRFISACETSPHKWCVRDATRVLDAVDNACQDDVTPWDALPAEQRIHIAVHIPEVKALVEAALEYVTNEFVECGSNMESAIDKAEQQRHNVFEAIAPFHKAKSDA